MRRASLQQRLVLGAIAWIVLALIVVGVVLSLLFRSHLEQELGRRLDADFLQLVAQLQVSADGQLTHVGAMSNPLYQRAFSGRYWQVETVPGQGVDGTATLLRSRSLWQQTLATQEGGERLQHVPGPRDMPLLVVTRRITLPRRALPLRVSVAASLVPVERAVAGFRITTALTLGILALGLILAVVLQVALGLHPLRRLRTELGRVRGAQATRLGADYPVEVAPLVTDMNEVLARNEALVERARRQAGNLAHALKTPLSVIANEASRLQRAGQTEQAQRLQTEVSAMQRQIDWHLARARIAGTRGRGTPLAAVLEPLQRTLQRLHADRGLVIEVQAQPALVFAGDKRDLEQMVGNLLENACKWAHGVIIVTARAEAGQLVVAIDDDGHGLSASQRSRAMQRGRRFDETTPGSGLGLAIVNDLAAAYGGRLQLEQAALGGLSARLLLPLGAMAETS